MRNWYLTKEITAYNGAKTVSSINSVGKTRLVRVKKVKLIPYTKINSMDKRLKYK